MSNTGNTQQIIDYGATANDGTGDPLRTAFIKTDENFSNIWAAGPVGSNITIANNTIQNDSTNGNIILKPNGTGVIQANASILPSIANVRDLGSNTRPWRRAYITVMETQDLTLSGNLDVAGDAVVQGNLTVEGDTIQIGNITTDTLLIQLANAATTDAQADGAGVTVGANDDIATILYDSTSNTWTTNIGISAAGNVTAPYFIGNGGLLTGMYGNANVVANLAALSSNPISTTGNVTAGYFLGNGGLLTGMYGNANVVANLAALASNPVSTTGNITSGNLLTAGSVTATGNISANYFVGNGSQLTGVSNYANANAVALGESGWAGNIIPAANAVYSLGNSTMYWSNLWVANNTIYIGGVPLGISAGNVLTVGGNAVLTTGSNTTVSTTGNITADYFFGNGSQLTGMYGNANVVANLATLASNPISTTGNVTAGYFLGNGSLLTGMYGNANVVANLAALSSNPVSTTGNVTGGNITTGGVVTATGNITGSYFLGNGSQLTGLPATYGNVNVVANLAALSSNPISTTGNVTAGYVLGNGSQLTDVNAVTVDITDTNGLTTIYYPTFVENRTTGQIARADVDLTYRTDENLLTVGNVSVTGNVTANSISGNILVTGNVTGTTANVTLIAGSYSWTFDNTGNLQGNVTFTGANILINNAAGAGGADEGGQLNLATPTANTSLSGPMAVDVYQNKIRFFETTGNTRGMFIDFANAMGITGGATGVPAIGYRDIPQVSFTGNATIAATDAGKHYYSTQSTNYTLTIANNTSVGWSVGTAITIVNRGTGNMAIAQGTGVSLYLAGNNTAGNRTVTTYGMATLLNVAANVWMINGTGVS